MTITEQQKRHLRGLAHKLKPVVTIGNAGFTEAVQREIDLSLEHHELIKIKLPALEHAERDTLLADLCAQTDAHLIQRIGHVAVLYRPAKKPKLKLP